MQSAELRTRACNSHVLAQLAQRLQVCTPFTSTAVSTQVISKLFFFAQSACIASSGREEKKRKEKKGLLQYLAEPNLVYPRTSLLSTSLSHLLDICNHVCQLVTSISLSRFHLQISAMPIGCTYGLQATNPLLLLIYPFMHFCRHCMDCLRSSFADCVFHPKLCSRTLHNLHQAVVPKRLLRVWTRTSLP